MVRLIDADKMLKRIESWNTSDAMDKALYNFTLNRIIEQPTVDAVPVEWIETDIEASAFSGYDMHAYEVASMLEEWKEKERNEE